MKPPIVVPLLALSHRLLFFLPFFFSPQRIELSSAARFYELSLSIDSTAASSSR